MKIAIVAVGSLREEYLKRGCAEYLKRLHPYASVEVDEIRGSRGPKALDDEARSLLARRRDGDIFWALDVRGTTLTSPALARKVAAAERSGSKRLVLAIGGAEGLHRSVIERADFRWSLSPLTFLHEMARLVALEQLYRAMKINRGEPYHR